MQFVLVEWLAAGQLLTTIFLLSTHPSMSFFIDRSDLKGNKLKQNAISLH
jgi:hypothetical protein